MPMPDFNPDHVWLIACTFPVTERQARRGVFRQSIRLPKDVRVRVEEAYCAQCRRPYDDVAGEPCEAAASNKHLIGGPIGERKKRRHNHRCDLLGCDRPDEEEGPRAAVAG